MTPIEGPTLTSPPRTSDRLDPHDDPPSPMRAVLVGLLIGLVSAAVGIAVGALTLPTSDELQRATLEEIGLDPGLLDSPLLAPIVDELSRRIQDRVAAEARRSVVLAVASSTLVAVGGVVIALLVSRRRLTSTRDGARHMPYSAARGSETGSTMTTGGP